MEGCWEEQTQPEETAERKDRKREGKGVESLSNRTTEVALNVFVHTFTYKLFLPDVEVICDRFMEHYFNQTSDLMTGAQIRRKFKTKWLEQWNQFSKYTNVQKFGL